MEKERNMVKDLRNYDELRGELMSVTHRFMLFKVGYYLSRICRYKLHGDPLAGLCSLEKKCEELWNKAPDEDVLDWNDRIMAMEIGIRKYMRIFNPPQKSKSKESETPICSRIKDYLMGYRRR